jgi:NADPH-dependent 2,4-dienoyl-CoA reductase/sulfur reductase-like enzyme
MKVLEIDVAVIGGGPAGMAAALAASREGVRGLLVERNPYLGGRLSQCIHDGFGLIRFGNMLSGPEYADIFIKQIENDKNITLLPNTMVTNIRPGKELYCVNRDSISRIIAKALVFATGCRERTRGAIAIPGTRPAGIYTAGLAQYLMNICNIAIGKQTVVLGSGDIGMIMARRLTLSGVKVECVLEKLPYCSGLPRNVHQCLEDYGIPLHLSRTVTGIRGNKRLESVVACDLDANGIPVPGREYIIPCDTLILSVGLIPENEVIGKSGVELLPETNGPLVNSHLETSVGGIFTCGNALHVNDLVDNVSDEGEQAGKWAAFYAQGKTPADPARIPVHKGTGVRYVTPQTLCDNEETTLNLRVTTPGNNKKLRISSGGNTVMERSLPYTNPAEMILAKIPGHTGSIKEILVEVV